LLSAVVSAKSNVNKNKINCQNKCEKSSLKNILIGASFLLYVDKFGQVLAT
jgi:hypothetical protein